MITYKSVYEKYTCTNELYMLYLIIEKGKARDAATFEQLKAIYIKQPSLFAVVAATFFPCQSDKSDRLGRK